MLPTSIVADKPLRPLMASLGMPHSGAMRGNSTNSASMIGAPSAAIDPAIFAACSSGGLPTGMCALTSAVSRPSSATSMASAVSRDWEKKKLVSMVKKPRKNTTKASRRARTSSVFKASSSTISVIPASRPSSVRCVYQVAASATPNSASSHQREGSGLSVSAKAPRSSNKAALNRLHHNGRWFTCGMTTQATTASRNKVSRLSRGSCLRRFSMLGLGWLSKGPGPPPGVRMTARDLWVNQSDFGCCACAPAIGYGVTERGYAERARRGIEQISMVVL